VLWVRVADLPAKFPTGGEGAVGLVADPIKLMSYKAEWDAWLENAPQAVRSTAPPPTTLLANSSSDQDADGQDDADFQPLWKLGLEGGGSLASLPAAEHSVLQYGVHTCAKWSVLATETAFFHSVTTALTVTPFVSMGAIAVFSRSLIISYVALYTLIAMVLTLLGVMKLFAIPLGVTSALALSLVVGMSVDYIIHIAHAYKHSIFADRFYKSRATIFARASSILSAAATTLIAVSPVLAAQLLLLREFGQIFFLVTLVSVCFSIAFLVVLMLIGPKATRGYRTAHYDEDEEEAPPAVQNPHSEGDGWAVQVVDQGAGGLGVEDYGPRYHPESTMGAMPPRPTGHGGGLASQDGIDDELL